MQKAEFSELVDRSRNLADTGDLLSEALGSSDQAQIDDAVDDLLAAYEQFRTCATKEESRLSFDELASTPQAVPRDQLIAEGLAAALLELEVARVLARAAEQTGELGARRNGLDEAVQSVMETVAALDVDAQPGGTRFAFDEVAAPPAGVTGSPDLPTAKATFEERAKAVYDLLFEETATLLGNSMTAVTDLDASKISESIGAVTQPLRVSGVGRIAMGALESVKRAIDRLKELLGSETIGHIDKELSKQFDKLRQGGGLTRQVLSYFYARETGLKKIEEWLEGTPSDKEAIDRGNEDLADLHQRAMQFFALVKRIGRLLTDLTRPVKFILQKLGGTLPVDLIVGGAHFFVMIVALVRGMDYADTAPFFGIEGVVAISRRALGVAT